MRLRLDRGPDRIEEVFALAVSLIACPLAAVAEQRAQVVRKDVIHGEAFAARMHWVASRQVLVAGVLMVSPCYGRGAPESMQTLIFKGSGFNV